VLANSLKTADRTQAFDAPTEADQIAKELKDQGITSAKVNRIFRSVGLGVLEMDGDGLVQEGQNARLGGWNPNVMRQVYSKHVPLQAAMIMAGCAQSDALQE